MDSDPPFTVEFPLRGEWVAPNSPGTKVPSHGTDMLGERYAYDFLQVDRSRFGSPFYRVSIMQYLFAGAPLDKCLCWGEDIHAPADGIVVRAADGVEERPKAFWLSDLRVARRNRDFDPGTDDLRAVAGNHVIMKLKEGVYAAFAHLQNGSLNLRKGQQVVKGEILGKVGHSGNSTAPHLHFQLMDREDMATAEGVPCNFESYEVFENGKWKTVANGTPSSKDRFRFVSTDDQHSVIVKLP